VIREALFWAWLGGVVGFTAAASNTVEIQAGLRRTIHLTKGMRWPLRWASRGTNYLVMTLGMLAWPLLVVVRFTVGDWLADFINRKYDRVDVYCSVCGLKDRVSVPKRSTSWTSVPHEWLISSKFELACSAACAHHLDHCPAHPASENHLH
jgi:hypothetical protein